MDRKLKLLVMDDESSIVDYTTKIFRLKGFETFGAKDSDEALAIVNRHRPEICILDIFMINSPLDGIEVLAEIRKIAPETVCIMFTRITDHTKMEEAGALGAFDFLLKPLDPQKIRDTVEAASGQIAAKDRPPGP
jgi:DNA-binding NtrC family response regulator